MASFSQEQVMHRCRFLLVFVLLLVLQPRLGSAQELTPPFVAGFDRFARHGEIDRRTAGQLLISELSCTACHLTTDSDLQPKRGPNLHGIGNRVQFDWLKSFLQAPHQVKPGTTMPHMLGSFSPAERKENVNALAAFLATQTQTFPELRAGGANPLPHEFWQRGNIKRGEKLYHQIGCVACHEPDTNYEGGTKLGSALDQMLQQLDPEEIEAMGLTAAMRPVRSVPHGELAAKYSHQSLTYFLLNPHSVRPAGRMPNFRLEPVDAADISAYLLRKQQPQLATTLAHIPNTDLIVQGRKLFLELQCANCHSLKGITAQPTARPFVRLDPAANPSCLKGHSPKLPEYPLDKQQVDALQSALVAALPAVSQRAAAADPVTLHLLKQNCFACHERGKLGGVGRQRQRYFETAGRIDIGDEGRFPPALTGVGRKLQPSWMTKVLQGKGNIRSHLQVRMPSYSGSESTSLPSQFARADGAKTKSAIEVFGVQKSHREPGRQLLNIGCIQCHSLNEESLPGVVGTDLAGVTTRLHPEWFKEFLLNPGGLKKRTRMPSFFPNGKSSNEQILDGDVHRQIDAMWQYLADLDHQPLPEKLLQARSKAFELVPQTKPLLLRTFMKEPGTHAIAVGFPQQVHFAFDAETLRLAQVWRGQFVDAYGTWFVRSAPPAIPLGKHVLTFSEGTSFAVLKTAQDRWPQTDPDEETTGFKGYRLDENGVPVFLYQVQGFQIEDRITPGNKQGLKRQFTITPPEQNRSQTLWLRAHQGKTLTRSAPQRYRDNQGVTVSLRESLGDRSTVHKTATHSEWRIPLNSDRKTTIEVNYQW